METGSELSALDASEARSVERPMNAIRAIVRAQRINSRLIEQRLGLTLAQVFVLQQLADRPADCLNDLADRTATHQSSVSVVVGRLVERGFVRRSASRTDRRRVQFELTPAGREILAEAPTTISRELVAALRRLTRVDREKLADLLERWVIDAQVDLAMPPLLGEA
jgi:DNA-binding MarR family transcriptional regulator